MMKKILLLLMFPVLGVTAAMAQTNTTKDSVLVVTPIAAPAPAPIGPSLQFEEQKFDFGDIKPGEVVEHTFTFTNNGTLPLIIQSVKTTCGCTATEYPKSPVMPGETAAITARFDSAGKRGKQNKVITIESNAVQGKAQVIIATNIVSNE
jgi:hypothetical protein